MITVSVDEEFLLELLSKRLDFWHIEGVTKEVFMKMYESQLNDGCWSSSEFDAKVIVDNDWCNWCSLVYEGDKDYDTLLSAYKRGERDVSGLMLEDIKASYIEAVSDDETTILTRY